MEDRRPMTEETANLASNLESANLSEYQGTVGITGSRDAIRQAFNKELISQGDDWMRMVEDRIQTVHTYNEDTASEIQERILMVYYFLFEDFYNHMKNLL